MHNQTSITARIILLLSLFFTLIGCGPSRPNIIPEQCNINPNEQTKLELNIENIESLGLTENFTITWIVNGVEIQNSKSINFEYEIQKTTGIDIIEAIIFDEGVEKDRLRRDCLVSTLTPTATPTPGLTPTPTVVSIAPTPPQFSCNHTYLSIPSRWESDYTATGFVTLKNLYTHRELYPPLRDNLDWYSIAYYNNRKVLEEKSKSYSAIDPEKGIEKDSKVFLPPPSWIDEYRAFPIPILKIPNQFDAKSTISISGTSALYPLSLQLSNCFNSATGFNHIQVEPNGVEEYNYCQSDIIMFNGSEEINKETLKKFGCAGIKFYKFEIARYAIAIIINDKNPDADKIRDEPLTPDELQNLLTTATSWSEVRSGFSNQPINRYFPAREGGTFNIVRNLLFPIGEVNSDIPNPFKNEDDYSIASKVVSDPYSIGLTGYGAYQLNKGKLRAIPITGFSPNSDTLKGDKPTYPLTHQVFLYTGEQSYNENPLLQYFISYYLAYELDFIDKFGFFPPSKDGFLNNPNTIP